MSRLAARQVKGAVVFPTIRVASHPGKLLMGVFDADDTYVEGTVLDRRSGEQGAPVPRDLLPAPLDSAAPEAIYAGPLYFHFGHFLLESLARAWYAERHPDLPFVWAGAHTWQEARLRPWQEEILDILGIANPTRIIADPTRFDTLHIPDIGYRYDDWFHPEHAAFLGRYDGLGQREGERLWLSRSKLPSDARDLNAAPTERRLADAGWTVAHPESLGVREQLDLLSRAEVVAGEEGSAFHLLILLKDVTSKRFLILRRYGQEHGNMRTVGEVRQVDQSFYSLASERVVKAEGRVVSKVTPNASEILDLLGVPVPPPRGPDTRGRTPAALRRVMATLAPDRVLDVGARDADLVLSSTAATRVAVSPRFDFDPRQHAASGVDFYELDLDSFVTLFHEKPGVFDVIRIAGEDFQSVMAAFRLTKRLAHDQTTWLFGSSAVAARAAVAVRAVHPGYTSYRMFVKRTAVFVARRVPGEPKKDGGVGRLSDREIAKRTRRLPVARLRPRRATRPWERSRS